MNAPTIHTLPGRGAALRFEPSIDGGTLLDLMYDGFYLVVLLRRRSAPADGAAFRDRVKRFLDMFERAAKRANIDTEDVYAAKYAFCALVDETVLGSQMAIRTEWERNPLQLQFFGDQLAGENFFKRLEELRSQGAARLQSLEVFHMCLLLGFQGKYLLEGPEKLGYLSARLGDEITHLKGKRAAFAPRWAPPDQIRNALRNDVPLWVIGSVFAAITLVAYIGLRTWLGQSAEEQLAGYEELIKLPPATATLKITLP